TLCVRAMTSSGWHGFVIQSSAPRRRPLTRWATVEGPVHTTIPNSGNAPHSRSNQDHAWGPSTARSTTSALRRIETMASLGTGLAGGHETGGAGGHGAGEPPIPQAEPVKALAQHLYEAAVAVQHGDTQRGGRPSLERLRHPVPPADALRHRPGV